MDSFRRVKIINIAPPGERVIIYHENSHLNLSCRWKTDGIFQIAYIESGEIVISTVTIKKGTDIKIIIGKLLSKVRYNNIDFAKRYAQDKISEVFRVFNKD